MSQGKAFLSVVFYTHPQHAAGFQISNNYGRKQSFKDSEAGYIYGEANHCF